MGGCEQLIITNLGKTWSVKLGRLSAEAGGEGGEVGGEASNSGPG